MAAKKKSGLSFYKETRISDETIKIFLGYAFWIFLAVFLAYIFVFFVGIKTSMIGSSMEPVLYNGQEILIDRVCYNFMRPRHGDVIVFRPNGNDNAHFYIKRVVGIPGDKIKIEDGVLYLNDHPEPLLFYDKIEDAGMAHEEITVPEDEYFVMGDNCNNSEDSRSANIGNISFETIYGKAWFHMAAETEGIGVIK